MNKKWLPIALVIVLGIALFVVKRFQTNDTKPKNNTTDTGKDPASNPANRDRGFDRRTAFLEYSNHAKCRMQCRNISQAEVEHVMRNGKINYNKSDLKNTRCPRYALEGITQDNQRVRIVYAQCNEKTTVVTVIDLDTDWTCDCPGDDKKYQNKK